MNTLFNSSKTLIGMIHLPPLPGYPAHPGMDAVIKKACMDIDVLQKSGYDAALVENDCDQPHKIIVDEAIKQTFKQIMPILMRSVKIPVGMEIIYDMVATVDVAMRVGAPFVRLDVFVDNVETRWGKIPAQAGKIKKLIQKNKSDGPLLLTDIHVKHAHMLDNKTIVQSAKEAVEEGSHCIIVTGPLTGIPPSIEDCMSVKNVVGDIPVIAGSGIQYQNAPLLLKNIDGAIVGSSIKTGDSIDLPKAIKLARVVKRL